jgi:hypothetical protein
MMIVQYMWLNVQPLPPITLWLRDIGAEVVVTIHLAVSEGSAHAVRVCTHIHMRFPVCHCLQIHLQ